MILFIDDEKFNYEFISMCINNKYISDKIIYSKYLEESHFNINWDLVFIDQNNDRSSKYGEEAREILLRHRIDLIDKVFVISASDYFIDNFKPKFSISEFLKNYYKINKE